MNNIERIIDVNFNRGREGLRVLEDISRFILNNSELTKRIKTIRHKFSSLLKNGYPYIFSRGVKEDVGASLTLKEEGKREDYSSIVQANAKRTEEALRVIEEFSKLEGKISEKIKEIRFQLYDLEKDLLLLISPALPSFPIYVIVDPEQRKRNFISFVEGIVNKGAKIIQLRAKNLDDRNFYSLGKRIREITEGKSTFIINDRIDLALSLSADGVHLGQDDIPVKEVKKVLCGKIIGLSCHNEKEALLAQKEKVSYISLGSIFETETKETKKPVGPELIKRVKEKVHLPIVAIGGIDEGNIEEVFNAGADYAAVISAISSSQEPERKLRRLVKIAQKLKVKNERD